MDGFLVPSTFSWLGLLTVKGWYCLGLMLAPGKLLEIQFNEPSSDFSCDVKDNINKDLIRGMCFDQYQKQNNKLGLPLYAFITFNFLVIHIVAVIYSQFVKSTVRELESHHQDAEQRRSCRLFFAYFFQLAVSCGLRIIFIAFLEIELFYPKAFPANFTCSIENVSVEFLPNQTKSANSVHCFTQRAGGKNLWMETVKCVNGVFALFAFLDILTILLGATKRKNFMDNRQFYVDHLKSNADEQRLGQQDFHSAITTLKESYLQDTQQLSDLDQPFRRPKPGEGDSHDLTMDEIYVHAAIHEGRAQQHFAKYLDRREKLKEYPPDEKDCKFAKPEDILDKKHRNVLVVGRPGIGKTSLSIKMLRLWASGKAFNAFDIVFLVKFRRFNDNAELSLFELLARSETAQRLSDSVLKFVESEPKKVLLIFDGLDEFSGKEDISVQEDDLIYKNNVKEKMPFSVLYKKLATGKLLLGSSILTTTRPKAVEHVARVKFQRTVEILGFTSKNVEDYVRRFSKDCTCTEAKEKIWEHIKSNTNLFSLCYIPVNCFLICHCLLQIFLSGSYQQLPTKITDIYQMIVKMVFFNHNRKGFSQKQLEQLKLKYMYEPFKKFPKELKIIFNRLGEIAFKGIEEGRLLFESSEVNGLDDCGLLHKLPDVQSKRAFNDPPKSQFCFTHLTVQEFFAAKHLVDNITNKEIERFIRKHISDGTWQVVLQFVAGLLKSSSLNIFVKLLPTSTDKKTNRMSSKLETLTSWPATEKDQGVAVQVCKCLYEINDEQQSVLKNKIETIKFNAVDFSGCSLAPIDLPAVLHLLENAEEVLYIDLSGNELADLGGNEVKKFIVNRRRKVKWLDLSNNNLSDNAAKKFAAALKHSNCTLELLHLKGNKFTDNIVKDFAAALTHCNCRLESLYLSESNFTDNAAKDFAAALTHSNCKLKSLDLHNNNLTDEAAKDLAAALKHSNCKLESLYLCANNFTDKGAKDLAPALQHSNCKLELLDLRWNNFTKERRKFLTDAGKQSNCKVYF